MTRCRCWRISVHPDVLRIGDFTIHSYGVMVALAFLVGMAHCIFLARRAGVDPEVMSDLCLWVMISGIMGARAAHVVAEFGKYAANPVEILYIHRGGLIFYGGVAGAIAGTAVFAAVRRKSFLVLGDVMVVSLPIGHALGRIGCFLNGCCFGTHTDSFAGVRFPVVSPAGWSQFYADEISNDHLFWLFRTSSNDHELRRGVQDLFARGLISGDERFARPVHPVQLYEAFLDMLLYAALMTVFFNRRKRPGTVAAVYLLGYGAIRFNTEMLRGDGRQGLGIFTVAQVVSLAVMAIAAIFLLVKYGKRQKKTDGAAA